MARPDSIHTIGLKQFLNDSAEKHRGLDYDVFCAMVEGKASIASMARSFKVNFKTMEKWLAIHREEKLSAEKTAL